MHFRFLSRFFAISALLLTPALLSAASDVTELPDVEIGKVGDRVLHADLDFSTDLSGKPKPAVIWVHGGGWSGGSYHGNPAEWLAKEGFFTASIEYRLSGEAKWPAQLEDCQQAVRWLKENATKYNVDPKRIAVWGHSAGGHLVAWLGIAGDGKGEQVQAVIDFSGPTDLTTGKAVYGWAVSPLLDDKGLTATDREHAASPLFAVKPGMPPFLIVHGDNDKVVPHEESVRLQEALEKAGVKSELITVKDGGHGFEGAAGSPVPQPDYNARNAAILAFLKEALK